MSTVSDFAALESSIAPYLLRPDRTPKHQPGTYQPPYPSFSARFDERVGAVVMAYLGVQARDPADPALSRSLDDLRRRLAGEHAPDYWDRASYVDAAGFTNVISIAYWTDKAEFSAWFAADGESWACAERAGDGLGYFAELVWPTIERFETIFSANDRVEGVAGASQSMSGMIEEHAYWGSMRDRLPLAQTAPLYSSGAPKLVAEGPVRTVVLPQNACLIRSGQDLTDCGEVERDAYLGEVEPSLRAGMDFLRDAGRAIGCFDNRYLTVLDDNDQPTQRTFGMSWWRDLAALEDWAASHPTHVKIFGVAMRHLSSFGPDTRLRLYHEVSVPSAVEQRFVYVGCHDATGMLRAAL